MNVFQDRLATRTLGVVYLIPDAATAGTEAMCSLRLIISCGNRAIPNWATRLYITRQSPLLIESSELRNSISGGSKSSLQGQYSVLHTPHVRLKRD